VEIDAVDMKYVHDYELHLWIEDRIKKARAYARETDTSGVD
jgi:hypothetical protein